MQCNERDRNISYFKALIDIYRVQRFLGTLVFYIHIHVNDAQINTFVRRLMKCGIYLLAFFS